MRGVITSVDQCALCARSTHGVHHAMVEVNIVIGVVLGELHVVRVLVIPLVVCDEAVVRRTLGLIALVVIVVFVVASLNRILLNGRYTLYTSSLFSLHSCLVLSSPVLSCFVFFCLLFSCLSSAVFSSLSVPVFFLFFFLSVSVSVSVCFCLCLSLSPCGVVVVSLCCVLCGTVKTPCVDSKRARVYVQNASVCAGKTRAC